MLKELGVERVSYVIVDYSCPEPAPFLKMITEDIIPRFKSGARMLVYCTAGCGRSGIFVETLQRILRVDDPRGKLMNSLNKEYVEEEHQKLFLRVLTDAIEFVDTYKIDPCPDCNADEQWTQTHIRAPCKECPLGKSMEGSKIYKERDATEDEAKTHNGEDCCRECNNKGRFRELQWTGESAEPEAPKNCDQCGNKRFVQLTGPKGPKYYAAIAKVMTSWKRIWLHVWIHTVKVILNASKKQAKIDYEQALQDHYCEACWASTESANEGCVDCKTIRQAMLPKFISYEDEFKGHPRSVTIEENTKTYMMGIRQQRVADEKARVELKRAKKKLAERLFNTKAQTQTEEKENLSQVPVSGPKAIPAELAKWVKQVKVCGLSREALETRLKSPFGGNRKLIPRIPEIMKYACPIELVKWVKQVKVCGLSRDALEMQLNGFLGNPKLIPRIPEIMKYACSRRRLLTNPDVLCLPQTGIRVLEALKDEINRLC